MKYIDADKLLDIIIKMQKEYATQEVTEEHKGLRAVLGGQCLVLTEIIEIIDSLQQEQESVAERFARIVRENLNGIDKDIQQKFEKLYFEVTGNKMYGGYYD